MNASPTRRQMIGSAAVLLGAAVAWIRSASDPAVAVESAESAEGLDGTASATAPAVRLRLVGALGFPVGLPGDLILLDNFGEPRLFGSGPHQGIDIGRRDAQPGHPVVACVDGVLVAQNILTGNQGNSWVLQGSNGDAYRYHHLESFAPDLAIGTSVRQGQVLGTMGATGNPTSPHLHFEVRRGGPTGPAVDPFPLLARTIPGVTVI